MKTENKREHPTNPNLEWVKIHGVREWRVKRCVKNALGALPDARKDATQRKPALLPKLEKRPTKDRIVIRRGVKKKNR